MSNWYACQACPVCFTDEKDGGPEDYRRWTYKNHKDGCALVAPY